MVGRMLWIGVALALVLASSSTPARAEEIVMKIATIAPDDTPWSELLKRYAKAVEEKSGGRINVKVFLGGALGDENETVIKCKRGQVQAVAASTVAGYAAEAKGAITAIDPAAGTVTLADGQTYKLPAQFDAASLQVGQDVTITYDQGADRSNTATESKVRS